VRNCDLSNYKFGDLYASTDKLFSGVSVRESVSESMLSKTL